MKNLLILLICLTCFCNNKNKNNTSTSSLFPDQKKFIEGVYVRDESQREFNNGNYIRLFYANGHLDDSRYGHYNLNDSLRKINIVYDSAFVFDQNQRNDYDFMDQNKNGFDLYYRNQTDSSIDFFLEADNYGPAKWEKWKKIR